MFTGAIAQLQAPTPDYTFVFSLVEMYGGAHLAFPDNVTVESTMVVGDDTSTILIGPHQTLDINGVSFRRCEIAIRYFVMVIESNGFCFNFKMLTVITFYILFFFIDTSISSFTTPICKCGTWV